MTESAEKVQFFMEAALQLGQEALSCGEVPVGCVFVKNGQIIGQGYNRTNELKNVIGSEYFKIYIHRIIIFGLFDRE